MSGDVPASIANLTNLKEIYLQNEHLTPIRQRFCRTRIPNVGQGQGSLAGSGLG